MIGQGRKRNPIRFGESVVPTRRYAELWPEAITRYFTEYRDAYRQRLLDFWAQELERWPDLFLLAAPVEAVIVGTLAAAWIFIRPAITDSVRIVEEWEHETFADWTFMAAPVEHRIQAVGEVFLEGGNWTLLEELQLAGVLTMVDNPSYYGTAEYAHHLADGHVKHARVRDAQEDGVTDEAGLAQVWVDLKELERSDNPQTRGRKFEAVMERLLIAHGCTVERGELGESEQVDLFMVDPQYALIECRWEKAPLESEVIYALMGKLRKRPPAVAGVYVSMSGFTAGAEISARDERDRTVILLGGADVLDLVSGSVKFRAFWQARMRDLIVRYRS